MTRTRCFAAVLLVAALLGSIPAGSEQSGSAGEIRIEVLTEEGFRTLDYSIVGTVTPTIRITGPLPRPYRVFNDRPDGRAGVDGGLGGLGREITDSFAEIAPGVVEGTLAFLYGTNDIIITDDARIPNMLVSVEMLNYTPDFEDVNGNGLLDREEDLDYDGILDEGEDINRNGLLDHDEDIIANGILDTGEDANSNGILDSGEDLNGNGVLDKAVHEPVLSPIDDLGSDCTPEGLLYQQGVILLSFQASAGDVEISSFLRERLLRPYALIVDETLEDRPVKISAQITDDTPAYIVERTLNGLAPDDTTFPPEVPPKYPLALASIIPISSLKTTAGERLPQRLLTGDPPNAGEAYRAASGGFDHDGDAPDELDIAWQHFFMDTFAAHRLVDVLVPHPTHRPAVAVIDTGFGNGVDADLGDIAVGRLYQPTSIQIDRQTPPRIVTPPTLANEWMRDPKSHGTSVALFAAGDGTSRILGTGKDVRLYPLKVDGNTLSKARALARAGRDPQVAVISLSWGPCNFDTNLDGRISNVLNENGIGGDGSDPKGDANGDGNPDDDGNWTIADDNDGNGRPSTNWDTEDTNGNGVLDAGEDSNGNGRLDDYDSNDDCNKAYDPEPHVDDDPLGSELSRIEDEHVVSRTRSAYLEGINLAYANEKIVVICASNEGHDGVQYCWPGAFSVAPRHGAIDDDGDGATDENAFPLRDAPGQFEDPPGVPFFMGVSATGLDGPPTGPEISASFTNFGSQVSVSAPGVHLADLTATNPLGFSFGSGTSYSTPYVSGLAGELIYLDRNLNTNPATGQPGIYSAQQIVEFIEATADDLGTSQMYPGQGKSARNDDPGNQDDDRFGWGRINCWKAALSVVNRGLAEETAYARAKSYGGVVFESLRDNWINEANTKWYGFKIITSVKGATVWIGGKRLEDAGASVPNAPAITAYAGVRSDQVIRIGIPFEDPTSGIVPVGNQGGEYVITFSIERGDLVGGSLDATPTLSLRRPNETAADAPFFNLELGKEQLKIMRSNPQKIPGVVFDDFVFEVTPTDFGDASFAYPTDYKPLDKGYSGEGARHLNSNLEWLGKPRRPQIQSVSPEQLPTSEVDPDGIPNVLKRGATSYDLDRYDDGVVFYPLTYLPGGRGVVDFTVCVADPDTDRYDAAQSRTLFVNAWMDWNTNGQWEEGDEHVVDGLELDPDAFIWTVVSNRRPTTAINLQAHSLGTRPGWATFRAEFDVPRAIGPGELWARFRLDYRQDVGRADAAKFVEHYWLHLTEGPARFGEVEDYLIGADFGDAPDGGAGTYPTQKVSLGARHLGIHKEWLGESKTREPDACLRGSAVAGDQDGHANLGEDCSQEDRDVAEEAKVSFDQTTGWLQVDFTVRSTIAARGYDLMGLDDDGDKRTDEDPYKDGLDEDKDGKDGEDPPNEMKVRSLKPEVCTGQKETDVWSTPPWSGGKGRYHATDVNEDRDLRANEDAIDSRDGDADGLIDEDPPGVKPLLVNLFVDWNGDRVWDTSSSSREWVLRDGRIAPETFGKDGNYTLGEPFADENHNGVRDPGEPFTDSAGVETQKYTCRFHAPDGLLVPDRFWVRIRLAYAELSAGTIPDSGGVLAEKWIEAGIAHSTEAGRTMNNERGGALFGEVEDYPLTTLQVTKKPSVTVVPPGGEILYTIVLLNPTDSAMEDVRIVDALPAEVAFGAMVYAPSGISYRGVTHTVEGSIDLAPSAETVITYRTEVPLTAPPSRPITNSVTIETTTVTKRVPSPEVTVESLPVAGPPQVPYVSPIPKNVSDAARRLAWKGGQLGRTDPSQRWDAREDRPGDYCEPCGHTPMCVECMEWDLQAWQQRRKTMTDMMDLMTVLSYLREVSGRSEYSAMATIYWDAHWDGWHNRDRPR